MNVEYILGMCVGVLCGFLLVFLLFRLVNKLGGRIGTGGKIGPRCADDQFDERQLLARGIAYKKAFFALMIYVSVVSLLYEFADVKVLMSFAGMWLGICISIVIFAGVCIFHDAYMNLYENAKGIIMTFSVIAVLNVIGGLGIIMGDVPLLKNGVLSTNCVNLMVGLTFIIILVMFVGKVIYNKQLDEEDEE